MDVPPDETQPSKADSEGDRNAERQANFAKWEKLLDTQPSKVNPEDTKPRQSLPDAPAPNKLRPWILVFGALILFGAVSLFSGIAGFRSGQSVYNGTATAEKVSYLDEQYLLALENIQNKQYSLAEQRLNYILSQDPDFRDAKTLLLEILVTSGSTATPTPIVPEITPTPDLRPSQELMKAASDALRDGNWDLALQTLVSLRKNDPEFNTIGVDRLIYVALRNRGADRILNQGELEGGIYDLALAEKFGPLDIHAQSYISWAELYLQGNAFWLAYPELALIYYRQVAAAAPNLSDTGGVTAFFRYWASLGHLGDQYAAENRYCLAATPYTEALNARYTDNLQATANFAAQKCTPPTITPTPTLPLWAILTQTARAGGPSTITPTTPAPGVTAPAINTATTTATNPPPGPINTATPTNTNPPPANTATPTNTNPPPPPSPTPTNPPAATPTPTPTPTNTPTPGGG